MSARGEGRARDYRNAGVRLPELREGIMSYQPHPMLPVINAQDLLGRAKRVVEAAYFMAETLHDDRPSVMEAICELAETAMDRIEEANFLLDQYRKQRTSFSTSIVSSRPKRRNEGTLLLRPLDARDGAAQHQYWLRSAR